MKQAPVDQTQNSLVNCLYSPTDQAQRSLVYILRYTVQETRARTPWLHVTLCILRYTEYYITASVLYFVQSYCFYHFLVNILKIIITAVPKLRSSIFIKKSLVFFFSFKTLLYRSTFQNTTRNRKSMGILLCEQHEKYPDGNVEKLCEVSRVIPNREKMSTFPILNLTRKSQK